jgi:hypothetical protein
MPNKLYYNTVDSLLFNVLKVLMEEKEFDAFRLVGGTALSLYRGHRKSIDIDRLATINEIVAMKLDVISRGGRKKDFWDLHELISDYTAEEMFLLHKQRYPYAHDPSLLKQNFKKFESADDDFDPICLKGKYWELIKLDMIEFVDRML